MEIKDLLSIESIDLHVNVNSKEAAIDHLATLHEQAGRLIDTQAFMKDIYDREELSSTGIGNMIAIPHAQSSYVKIPGLVAMTVDDGVDYQSLDGQPAKLFFMIAVPKEGGSTHLDILAKLCQILMEEEVRENLLNASTPEEFMKIIEDTMKEEVVEDKQEEFYDVLAVTACPTGIAHTYMAAKALEEKASQKGIAIKVETNGSSGIKNKLTKEEIENAKCIIVAADKQVEMQRFNNRPVIQCPVAKAIHETEELLDQAMHESISLYEVKKVDIEEKTQEKGIRKIYTHIMSGISAIIPLLMILGIGSWLLNNTQFIEKLLPGNFYVLSTSFVSIASSTLEIIPYFLLVGYIAKSIDDTPAFITGGICGVLVSLFQGGFIGSIIAGFICGYVMIGLKKILSYLPDILECIKPVLLYPIFGTIISLFIIKLVVLTNYGNIGFVALHQNFVNNYDSFSIIFKIVIAAILSVMMAIDMGGPINKTAYAIGLGSILLSKGDIMAAVMIGGMVPPLVVALSMTMFPNMYTREELQGNIRCYIMSACFVTEEAIPFMKKYRDSIFPGCLIGSAVAGGLSMFFGCSSLVPHGGAFVIFFMQQPILYLLSLVIGGLVGTIIIVLLYKEKTK